MNSEKTLTETCSRKEAISILFQNIVMITSENGYFFAKEPLLHLIAMSDTEEKAYSNLMDIIEEHINAVENVCIEKKRYATKFEEEIRSQCRN